MLIDKIKNILKIRKIYTKTNKIYYSNFISQDIPTDISITNIKKTLKANKLNFDDGFANIITECPLCVYEDNQTRNKVYINKTTGIYP